MPNSGHFVSTSIHYDDVIMTMLASQINSLTVVYSIVYSGVNQRKHQSSASLAFVREIHRGPVNFPHKWPVTRKMFPFDDVIMLLMDKHIWCGINVPNRSVDAYQSIKQSSIYHVVRRWSASLKYFGKNTLFEQFVFILSNACCKHRLWGYGYEYGLFVAQDNVQVLRCIIVFFCLFFFGVGGGGGGGGGACMCNVLTTYRIYIHNLWEFIFRKNYRCVNLQRRLA